MLLFLRTTAGRVILIVMSTLQVLLGGFTMVMSVVEEVPPPGILMSFGTGLAVALSILILASLSATGRWIRARRQPQHPSPQAPMYAQQPQYPYY